MSDPAPTIDVAPASQVNIQPKVEGAPTDIKSGDAPVIAIPETKPEVKVEEKVETKDDKSLLGRKTRSRRRRLNTILNSLKARRSIQLSWRRLPRLGMS